MNRPRTLADSRTNGGDVTPVPDSAPPTAPGASMSATGWREASTSWTAGGLATSRLSNTSRVPTTTSFPGGVNVAGRTSARTSSGVANTVGATTRGDVTGESSFGGLEAIAISAAFRRDGMISASNWEAGEIRSGISRVSGIVKSGPNASSVWFGIVVDGISTSGALTGSSEKGNLASGPSGADLETSPWAARKRPKISVKSVEKLDSVAMSDPAGSPTGLGRLASGINEGAVCMLLAHGDAGRIPRDIQGVGVSGQGLSVHGTIDPIARPTATAHGSLSMTHWRSISLAP